MARRGVTTPIFVPGAFDDGATVGAVVNCQRGEGDRVAAGDVLVELRSGRVLASVESPLHGTLSKLYLHPGEPVHVGEILAEIREQAPAGSREHSASAGRLVERAPGLVAFVLAAGALVWPLAWLVVTFVALAVVGAMTHARIGGVRGLADVVVVPFAVVAGGVRWAGAKLRGMLVPALFGLLLCVAVAVLVPAAAGALTWLVANGSDGAVAAGRLAVFAYAGRLFAFLVCAWLLQRALRAGEPARRMHRRVAAGAPELALTGAAVLGAASILVCAVAISPRPWWPSGDFTAFADDLPGTDRGSRPGRTPGVDRVAGERGHALPAPAQPRRLAGATSVRPRRRLAAGRRARPARHARGRAHRRHADAGAEQPARAARRHGRDRRRPQRQDDGFEPEAGARPVRDFAAVGASAAANERDLQVALACSAAAA